MDIASLEAARGGAFRYLYGSAVHELPDPAVLSLQDLLNALQCQGRNLRPPPMPLWKLWKLHDAWLLHNDLLDWSAMRRLLYLIDKYGEALEADLRPRGIDLAEFWRQRRFRALLNAIDHLPRNCWYSQAVSLDLDHAKMLAEQQSKSKEPKREYAPPMAEWSMEAEMLASVYDAVNNLNYTLSAVNHDGKGKKPMPSKPYPRPLTAMKRAEFKTKQAKHEELLALVAAAREKARLGLSRPVKIGISPDPDTL